MSGRGELSKKKCVPCKGDTPPLKGNALLELQRKLGGDWRVVEEHHLEKEYRFKDFREALDFTNRAGPAAVPPGGTGPRCRARSRRRAQESEDSLRLESCQSPGI